MSGSEFILILAIAHIGPVAILFPTQAACENAKVMATEEFHPRNMMGAKVGTVRALCVPRNTP